MRKAGKCKTKKNAVKGGKKGREERDRKRKPVGEKGGETPHFCRIFWFPPLFPRRVSSCTPVQAITQGKNYIKGNQTTGTAIKSLVP